MRDVIANGLCRTDCGWQHRLQRENLQEYRCSPSANEGKKRNNERGDLQNVTTPYIKCCASVSEGHVHRCKRFANEEPEVNWHAESTTIPASSQIATVYAQGWGEGVDRTFGDGDLQTTDLQYLKNTQEF